MGNPTVACANAHHPNEHVRTKKRFYRSKLHVPLVRDVFHQSVQITSTHKCAFYKHVYLADDTQHQTVPDWNMFLLQEHTSEWVLTTRMTNATTCKHTHGTLSRTSRAHVSVITCHVFSSYIVQHHITMDTEQRSVMFPPLSSFATVRLYANGVFLLGAHEVCLCRLSTCATSADSVLN